MNLCTVTSGPGFTPCGAPAVTSFVSTLSGDTLYECAEHDASPMPVAAPAPKRYRTRSERAFLIVDPRTDKVLGYADFDEEPTRRRARRLGGIVVRNI